MKPKPTQPKETNVRIPIMDMAESEKPARYAFMRDDARSVLGHLNEDTAKAVFEQLKTLEGDDTRVRLRYRSRTDRWDVVVKTRRAVAS